MDATQTIEGPVGVSNIYADFNPKTAEATPIEAAPSPIPSGVDASERAEAAGMISIAMINNTPTTFIPTATTVAKAKVSTMLSFFGFIPFAQARSSFNVTNNSGDQRQQISININPAPNHINRRSIRETASISPIKQAIKSIRIPDIKETITSPTARDICPAAPKSVSR